MIELAIVGAKNSGKTTVLEGLVDYLVSAGYRVATIKHTSHTHMFDTPGKDSFRHRQAGARMTVAKSDKEVAIFAEPDELDIRQVQNVMRQQIDLWLVEGDRYAAERPKVLVTRCLEKSSGALPENVVATIGPQRLDEVSTHFATEDYKGLGSFVCNRLMGKKAEIRE